MALSHRQKRRWSLIILLIGLPAYTLFAVWLMLTLDFLPLWLRMVLYVVLGFLWMAPFKQVFLGVGQADPDAPQRRFDDD